MQRLHGNTFQCVPGETVTMTFKPSDKGILRVLHKENIEDDFVDVGDDFQIQRRIDNAQVNIKFIFVFFPEADGNCRIFIEGSKGGGMFEDEPPAEDHPGLPEHRTYRFKV